MSYDLGVWYPHERRGDAEAGRLYIGICEGTIESPRPHATVDAFYEELTAMHPEIDDVSDDRIDDHDYCPWSCTLDRSPGHVITSCVWSKARYVDSLVHQLARKHGLAVFDPQTGIFTDPDSDPPTRSSPTSESGGRPWWRFW